MPRQHGSDAQTTTAAGPAKPSRAGAGSTAATRYAGSPRPAAPAPKPTPPAGVQPPIDFDAAFSLHLETASGAEPPVETAAEEADADRHAEAIVGRLPPAPEAGGTFAQHRHRFEAAMGMSLGHVRVRDGDGVTARGSARRRTASAPRSRSRRGSSGRGHPTATG
jgi:hypothetical protein